MRSIIRDNKGISLIALVVTVVVLVILTGITIGLTTGQRNIIKKSKEVVNFHENFVQDEQTKIDEVIDLVEEEPEEKVVNFTYTGEEQEWIPEVSGTYKLEVWGAEGGNSSSSLALGGRGGYSVGIIKLKDVEKLYVYVGGKGTDGNSLGYTSGETGANLLTGGFNGGGRGGVSGSLNSGGGGGASDIRINNKSSYARVIVAGGGGASSSNTSAHIGGAGGGENGINGYNFKKDGEGGSGGGGGTQTSGGIMNSTYVGTIKSTAGEWQLGGKGNVNTGADTGGGRRWRLVWRSWRRLCRRGRRRLRIYIYL